MNYKKPEVSTLGDATRVIEFTGNPSEQPHEIGKTVAPAYDLDE